jgi:hypothetical protein
MAFDNANPFQRSVRILGRYGCITSLAIVTLFRSMSDVMNLKKKGAGIVSTLCAKMGATKKLGEISIPGNSTTTLGSQKSLAFPTFFRKQKILFCVCSRRVSFVFVVWRNYLFFFFFSRLICLFRYTHALENDTNVVTAGLVTIVCFFGGLLSFSPFRPRFNVIQN